MLNTDDVELTISLRRDLAHSIKAYAAREGQTPEEFVVSALWELRKERGLADLREIRKYGKARAAALDIYGEEDLFRYLES